MLRWFKARILDQFTRRLEIFLAHPVSAKFALSRRLYNLINLVTPILHGKRVNICGWEGYRFKAKAGVTYISYNDLCPGYGSSERHRALINYMNRKGDFSIKRLKCLDIGPITPFQPYF